MRVTALVWLKYCNVEWINIRPCNEIILCESTCSLFLANTTIIFKIAMKQNQDNLLVVGLLVDTYLWEKQFLGVSCFDRLY